MTGEAVAVFLCLGFYLSPLVTSAEPPTAEKRYSWQSAKGDRSVEAAFVEADDETVTLQYANGRQQKIKLKDLDEASQARAQQLKSANTAQPAGKSAAKPADTMPGKPVAKPPAKPSAKSSAKTPAKSPAKSPAKTPAKPLFASNIGAAGSVGGRTIAQWIERIQKSDDSTELTTAYSREMWLRFVPYCGDKEASQLVGVIEQHAKGKAPNWDRGFAACEVLDEFGPRAKSVEARILTCYDRMYAAAVANRQLGALGDKSRIKVALLLASMGPSASTCERLEKRLATLNPVHSDYDYIRYIIRMADWRESKKTIMKILRRELAEKDGLHQGVADAFELVDCSPLQELDQDVLDILESMLANKNASSFDYSQCGSAIEFTDQFGPAAASLAPTIMKIDECPLARRLKIVGNMGPLARAALESRTALLRDGDPEIAQEAQKAFLGVAPDLVTIKDADQKVYLPWFNNEFPSSRALAFTKEQLQHAAWLANYGFALTEYAGDDGVAFLAAELVLDGRYGARKTRGGAPVSHGLRAIKLLAAGPLQVRRLRIELETPLTDAHFVELAELKGLQKLTFTRFYDTRFITDSGMKMLAGIQEVEMAGRVVDVQAGVPHVEMYDDVFGRPAP